VQDTAPLLNSLDASVSTVIGKPIRGELAVKWKEFQFPDRSGAGCGADVCQPIRSGQFSVNGQRPDANYFQVDGVSANLGAGGGSPSLGQSGAGQLPATSALGGTSNLVSLDALEEFRVQTWDLCAGIWAYSGRSYIGGHEVWHQLISPVNHQRSNTSATTF